MYKPVRDFSKRIRIAFSSSSDGCMPSGGGYEITKEHLRNTEAFLQNHDFPADYTKVGVLYQPSSTFTHIERIYADSNADIKADAQFTTAIEKPIVLPVADCIATVVHDPVAGMLGVLHMGRHSSVAGLIEEFVIRVSDELGSDPRDWHVWMSPSLQKESNILEYFEPPRPEEWVQWQYYDQDGCLHIDIPGHNRARFERAGVKQENIYVSPVDTYNDKRYFSHRAANELNRPDRQGRMMVVAVMNKS